MMPTVYLLDQRTSDYVDDEKWSKPNIYLDYAHKSRNRSFARDVVAAVFATFTLPIMHFVFPTTFCLSTLFNYSWDGTVNNLLLTN